MYVNVGFQNSLVFINLIRLTTGKLFFSLSWLSNNIICNDFISINTFINPDELNNKKVKTSFLSTNHGYQMM